MEEGNEKPQNKETNANDNKAEYERLQKQTGQQESSGKSDKIHFRYGVQVIHLIHKVI